MNLEDLGVRVPEIHVFTKCMPMFLFVCVCVRTCVFSLFNFIKKLHEVNMELIRFYTYIFSCGQRVPVEFCDTLPKGFAINSDVRSIFFVLSSESVRCYAFD